MEVSRGVNLFVSVDGPVMQSATLDQYFVEIDRTPLLSKEEEKALARAIMEGDLDARDAMIRANLQRQIANANHALALCNDMNVDWLLHIDADELIRIPADYLDSVPQEISSVRFCNHELAHQSATVVNPFLECKYFKRNPSLVKLKDWPKPYYFLYYGNGKSAVRVRDATGANGVHLFHTRGSEFVEKERAHILHYPCWSYEEWVRKYERLGDFTDYWWDNPLYKITFRFHLDSRDVIQTGDRAKWRSFYDGLLFTQAEIDKLISEDVVFYDSHC